MEQQVMTPEVPREQSGKLAVVYDRASTERQRDNYSRADAARLISLAEPLGFSRCELRQEIKSGESLSNRSVMKAILEEVEARKIGAIICQDFTRLSRDQDGIDGCTERFFLGGFEQRWVDAVEPNRFGRFEDVGDAFVGDREALRFFELHERVVAAG